MAETLVGRDAELLELRSARAARAPGMVVAARPGLGRTSVLMAVVAEWRERRADVLLIRATASSRRLKFAALSPLLTGHFDAEGFEAITFGGALTFDLVHDALIARAAHGSFVLAVDDLHLLDEASLRVIADAVGAHDSFVIATIDETFLGLDPLTERAGLPVLHLGPLDQQAIGAIAAERTSEPVDDEAWWRRCGGNPTVLIDALGRGTAPAPDDGDSLHPDLDAEARQLLAIVAFAEPVPVDVARTLDRTGPSAMGLDKLLELGLLAVSDEPWRQCIRLRHPGHSTRLRRSLGPLEARRARRAALSAMRPHWPVLTATERLQLAALAMESGIALTDAELLDVVALAPAAGDPHLALRLARRGAEQLGRFDDLRRLADVAHEQGQVDDVELAISRMRERATTTAEHIATAIALSQHLLWRCRDGAGAVAALEQSPASGSPELQALRARVLATIGSPTVAMAVATAVLDDPSPRVRAQAALALAHGQRRIGAPTQAVATLDRAIEAASAVTDPVLSVSHQVLAVVRSLAMAEACRWTEATDHAVRVLSYAERYDEAPGRAVALLVHGVAALESGSPTTSMSTLTDAVDLFGDLQQPAGSRWSLSARALAHAMAADPSGARHDLDELDRVGPHPADLFPSLEPRARAWTMVAEGQPAAARDLLHDAVDRFRATGAIGPAVLCAHDLVSLHQPDDLLDLPLVDGDAAFGLRLRHARAVQRRDLDELADLLGLFERFGGLRWAAECAAALSQAAVRAGSRDVARRSAERLSQLRARCVGLAIASVASGRALSLSVREREIALLAARGLTSREIGERLGLSVRTVDNHLARCFDKLGTRNRSELGELLAP